MTIQPEAVRYPIGTMVLPPRGKPFVPSTLTVEQDAAAIRARHHIPRNYKKPPAELREAHEKLCVAVFAAMASGTSDVKGLCRAVGHNSEGRVRRALDALIEAGKVREDGKDARNAVRYVPV